VTNLSLLVTTNTQSGASYTIQGTNQTTPDKYKTVNMTNGSATTTSIGEAGSTGLGVGFTFTLCASGATDTLTPSAGTVGGLASRTIVSGECDNFLSDNVSNWLTQGGVPGGISWPGSGPDTVELIGTNATISGTRLFTGAFPTLAQGDAGIGFDSTLGGTFGGSNASGTCDTAIVNASKAVAICVQQGSTQTTFGTSGAAAQSTDVISLPGSATGGRGIGINNNNAGTGSYAYYDLGTSANAQEGRLDVLGNSFSGGNGPNAFEISAVTGLYLKNSGTNALSVLSGGAIHFYNQPTTGTIVYAVCAAASANQGAGGALILDASGTVCGLSDERLKTVEGALRPAAGLADVMALRPIVYRWKPGSPKASADPGEHFGLGAWATAYVSGELAARRPDGTPRAWRDDAVIATLVAAVQEQQGEVVALQKRMTGFEKAAFHGRGGAVAR